MKMSELTPEVLQRLSWEQKWNICCSGIYDEGKTAEVALLLGSTPDKAVERALAAAKLYREGRAKAIIPTGGPKWEYRGEMLTEAETMASVLRENGVPDAAIIPENEAQTTQENLIYGTLWMNRTFHRIPDSCPGRSKSPCARPSRISGWRNGSPGKKTGETWTAASVSTKS